VSGADPPDVGTAVVVAILLISLAPTIISSITAAVEESKKLAKVIMGG
jgi:hypothetical protein